MQLLPFLSLFHFSFIFLRAFFFVRSQISFLASIYLHCWRTFFFSFSFFSFYWSMLLFLLHYSLAFVHYPIVRSLPNYSLSHSLLTYASGCFSLKGGVRKKKRNFEVGWSWVYLSSFSSFLSSKYIAMSLSAEAQILYNTSIVLGVWLTDWCGALCPVRKVWLAWVWDYPRLY